MDSIIKVLLKYPEMTSSAVQTVIYAVCLILLFRGLWIIFKGYNSLKKVSFDRIKKDINKPVSKKDPLTVYTAKIFFSAYAESKKNDQPYPVSFIEDATRQIASNTFETNYMASISNISNLFPPLGFIGTVFGMIFIFIAKNDPGSALNTLGLGAALFTTLGALVCFVFIEAIRIFMDRIAVKRIESGLNFDPAEILHKLRVEKDEEKKRQ